MILRYTYAQSRPTHWRRATDTWSWITIIDQPDDRIKAELHQLGFYRSAQKSCEVMNDKGQAVHVDVWFAKKPIQRSIITGIFRQQPANQLKTLQDLVNGWNGQGYANG